MKYSLSCFNKFVVFPFVLFSYVTYFIFKSTIPLQKECDTKSSLLIS